MNTRFRSALAALLVPLALLTAAPAVAVDEDPIPGPQTDPCGIVWRDREIAFWRSTVATMREEATAREVVILERALVAEDRVDVLTAEVAARTHERDRLLVQSQRWRVQRDRARATIQRLRARLAAAR